jgi:hypothetical protein
VDRSDVILLFAELVENYPNFDDSEANIDRHYKYLHDLPFDVAMKNIEQHIMTSKWPPTIAEIRGSLGEQIERNRMKAATDEYFAAREEAAKNACPPPPGWKEAVYAKLGRPIN